MYKAFRYRRGTKRNNRYGRLLYRFYTDEWLSYPASIFICLAQ